MSYPTDLYTASAVPDLYTARRGPPRGGYYASPAGTKCHERRCIREAPCGPIKSTQLPAHAAARFRTNLERKSEPPFENAGGRNPSASPTVSRSRAPAPPGNRSYPGIDQRSVATACASVRDRRPIPPKGELDGTFGHITCASEAGAEEEEKEGAFATLGYGLDL